MDWYSRNREFKYGDYDKSTKLYYNEDSNKWVSWLGKKQIIEKYIRYEFSCFDDREIEKHQEETTNNASFLQYDR